MKEKLAELATDWHEVADFGFGSGNVRLESRASGYRAAARDLEKLLEEYEDE